MIKDNIINDAIDKIVKRKMTIEAVSDEYADDKVVDENELEEKLEDLIYNGLAEAFTNYTNKPKLKWSDKWIPHSTRKGTKEELLNLPIKIKKITNLTVDDFIHANEEIKTKLENFMKDVEKSKEVASGNIRAVVSFPEKVGVLRWKSANTRKKVYNYWNGIFDKFNKLKKETNDWIETLGEKDGKNLKEALDRLENYIIESDAEEMPVNTHIEIFENILEELSERKVLGQRAAQDSEMARTLASGQKEQVSEESEEDVRQTYEQAAQKMDLIDPLLAVAISNGLTKLGLSKQTLEREKRRIQIEAEDLPPSKKEKVMDRLQELIADVDDMRNIDFYLPNTQFTSKNESQTDAMWEKHEDYLNLIHSILFKEGSRPEMGTPRGSAIVDERLRGQDIFVERRPAIKREEEIPPVLLDVIKEYYGPVLRTNKYFIGNPPDFMEKSIWEDISSLGGTVGFDFDEGLVAATQIDALTKFVSNYRKGAEIKNYDKSVENLAYTVWGILDKLFKGKYRQENKESIGWFLNRANAPQGERFMGESIKDLARKYEQGEGTGKIYPIMAMEGLINSRKFINLFNPKNPPTQGLFGVEPQVKKNLFDSIKELNEEYKRLAKKKKDINSQILETHDVIRKSLGKPIYYGMCDLTNIEDVSYLLKRLSNRGYDLTAMELTDMVESVSSLNRIAKSFGVNEETVYLAKGLCR